MMPEMGNETLVIDDVSEFETEQLIKIFKPDIICAGIKEKYGIQKFGIPCKQLHNYDMSGPYSGFEGAIIFYNDIKQLVTSNIWKYMKAPWQLTPELTGKFGNE